MIHMSTQAIIRFCSEECERQGSGEISVAVADMYDAWMWAMACGPMIPMNVSTIIEIGRRVFPGGNSNGFRRDRVMIGGKIKKVIDFDRVLTELCTSPLVKKPAEFYRAFEEVHPFIDGNGRVGAILYNALIRTLDNPIACPDVFDSGFWKRG